MKRLLLVGAVGLCGCGGVYAWYTRETSEGTRSMTHTRSVSTGSGLRYDITRQGQAQDSANVAQKGTRVTVHYTGWLAKGGDNDELGTKFDSSVDRQTPFTFLLGAGQVIKGWDEGVLGMRVGEKRRLFIPSALGYGANGAGNVIPPHANLIFDVELIRVVAE